MRAVIPTFELGYLLPARENAGGANSHHRAFSAGVREAYQVQRGDSFRKYLSESYLRVGWARERRPSRGLLLYCARNVRVGVTQDKAGGVNHEVQETVSVGVVYVVAFTALYEVRVGIEERRSSGTSAREILLRLGLLALGNRGSVDKSLYLLLEFFLCWHGLSYLRPVDRSITSSKLLDVSMGWKKTSL